MPYEKIQPIRMQENRRTFDGIIPNLPMMLCDVVPAEIW